MSLVDTIARLRQRLTDCERDLINAQDTYTCTLGILIKDVKIKATTKEARDIEIAGLLFDNGDYRAALASYRHAQWIKDRAAADLESALDARREYEWSIRCRLADALLSRGVQSDHADPAGDVAFDDSTNDWFDQYLSEHPYGGA